nr:hypothetical protein BaRGS_008147 [Batillaria attramentaria]
MLARRLVQSGMEDCVMALGFEKMEGGLSERYTDRTSPIARHTDHMVAMGADPGIIQPKMNKVTSDVIKLFAYAAREYMELYPQLTVEDLAKIAHKNRKQGENNPRASFQKAPDLKTITNRAMLCYPITFNMSAATADGSAAAIVCSEKFVFEVHDCFSCNELFMYEALHCAPEGRGLDLVNNSSWRRNKQGGEQLYVGNKWVFNPSGGLESKGHPIGLGQCAELVWQLRGEAGKRQVEGARVAMQHNFGIGGAAVVTMYGKYQPSIPMARL